MLIRNGIKYFIIFIYQIFYFLISMTTRIIHNNKFIFVFTCYIFL